MHDPDAVPQAWYMWKRSSKFLFLVEDQVSAVKLASRYHSVALLGTTLSTPKVEEIEQNNTYERIYLVLDNDATYEAIRTHLRWRHRLKNLYVKGLGSKDIKDMSAEEFQVFIDEVELP